MRRALEYNNHRRSIRSDSLIGSSSACPSLFLANLRFCVHYCIDRDTVQKKKIHGFFVVMSTTNLKMIWKQTANKQMYSGLI